MKYKFARVIKQRPDEWEEEVWQRHGDVGHMLSTTKPLSFDDIYRQMASDTTNFRVGQQEGPGDDRSPLPSAQEVAYGLVALLEVGFAKVVECR